MGVGTAQGASRVALLRHASPLPTASEPLAAQVTIQVDSTGDTSDAAPGDSICADALGRCTLRGAIEEANSGEERAVIRFADRPSERPDATPGGDDPSAPWHIAVRTPLPPVQVPIDIDGRDATGYRANSASFPRPLDGRVAVEIDGSATPPGASGLDLGAPHSRVQALSIHGFQVSAHGSETADLVVRGMDSQVTGSYLGVASDGLSTSPHTAESGLLVTESASRAVVGGTTPEARNVMAGVGANQRSATFNGPHAIVRGNYVNVGGDGMTDLGATFGLGVTGEGTAVGGIDPTAGNLISGAETVNLLVMGSATTVTNNRIGTDYLGQVNPRITNGYDLVTDTSSADRGVGVAATSAAAQSVLIGGTQPGAGNTIAGVGGIGVAIEAVALPELGASTPDNVAILGNRIYDVHPVDYPDGLTDDLGIDQMTGISLDDDPVPEHYRVGPTPADPGDFDHGPNRLMNYPKITDATVIDTKLTASLYLDTHGEAAGGYRIELFRSLPKRAEATELLGAVTVSARAASPQGHTTVVHIGTRNLRAGDFIRATATEIRPDSASGFGATSELSPAVQVGG